MGFLLITLNAEIKLYRERFCYLLFILWGKGCWGVKINQNRPAIVSEAEKMFHENHLHQYDYDQQLLIKYYQSMAAESMVYYKGTLYELNCCTFG